MGAGDRCECPRCEGSGQLEETCYHCCGYSAGYSCHHCGNGGLLAEDCPRCEGLGHLDAEDLTEDERLAAGLELEDEDQDGPSAARPQRSERQRRAFFRGFMRAVRGT